MNIALQIKTCRRNLNISQDRFGNKIGVSGKTVSAYETGRSYPSAKILRLLANEFDIYLENKTSHNKDFVLKKIRDLENNIYELKIILQ